jgi:hypothetical protein
MITRQILRLLVISLLFGGMVYVIYVASKPSLGADGEQDHRPEGSGADRKSALLAQFNLDDLSLDREDIYAGGPDKDGIPSLTRPKTLPVPKAEYPADARVAVVTVGKETRAYPLAILTWHEAINDVLGDVPIAVIYCPLCDSVSVVDRRLGETTIEFGISGLLHNSNVLLFDRKTDALWSQLGLQAVSGPHVGKALKHLPWRITTFARFRKESPEADIVGRETGHRRDYDRNPYAAYFRTDRLMFPVTRRDVRLKAKTPVVGVKIGGIARAYPVEAIRQANGGQVIDRLGSAEIALKADEDTVSIVKVPEGASVVHTFWFAWAAFHPDTGVHGQKPTSEEASTTAPDTSPDDQRSDSTE